MADPQSRQIRSKRFKRFAWGTGIATGLGWLVGLYTLESLGNVLSFGFICAFLAYAFVGVTRAFDQLRHQVETLYSISNRMGLVRVETTTQPDWFKQLFGPWIDLKDTSADLGEFEPATSSPIVTAYELVLEISPSQVCHYLNLGPAEEEAFINWQNLPNRVRWKRWTGHYESSEISTWHPEIGSKVLSSDEGLRGGLDHLFYSSSSDGKRPNTDCWHVELNAGESYAFFVLWFGSRHRNRSQDISLRILLNDNAWKPFLMNNQLGHCIVNNVDSFDSRISHGLPRRQYEYIDEKQGVTWRLTHYPELRKVFSAKVLKSNDHSVVVQTEWNGRSYGLHWREKEYGSLKPPSVGELVHVVINREGHVTKLWRTSQMYHPPT